MDDADGESTKDTLTSIVSGQNSGQVRIVFGDTGIDRFFSYDSTSYASNALQFTNNQIIPTGASGGSGKSVELFFVPGDPIVGASEYFRFPDGTTAGTIVTSWNGATGAVNAIQGVTYVAGFLFDGRGVTVAAAKKTDIVRPIEGTATIAELGIRLPEGAGGGTASASVYKVGSNYINTSGASLAADGITVGTIDLQNGLYGGTASGGGTMAKGDLIYCGVTGAGLGKIVQVFVTYEV
jgi:hypothetical protein